MSPQTVVRLGPPVARRCITVFSRKLLRNSFASSNQGLCLQHTVQPHHILQYLPDSITGCHLARCSRPQHASDPRFTSQSKQPSALPSLYEPSIYSRHNHAAARLSSPRLWTVLTRPSLPKFLTSIAQTSCLHPTVSARVSLVSQILGLGCLVPSPYSIRSIGRMPFLDGSRYRGKPDLGEKA